MLRTERFISDLIFYSSLLLLHFAFFLLLFYILNFIFSLSMPVCSTCSLFLLPLAPQNHFFFSLVISHSLSLSYNILILSPFLLIFAHLSMI